MLLALRSLWEPAAVVSSLRPGKVYKGIYPYWKQRRKPYWEDEFDRDEAQEEEELLAMMGIEL